MLVNVKVAIPGRFSAIFISCQHAHTSSASHLPLQAVFLADFTTAYVYTDAVFLTFSNEMDSRSKVSQQRGDIKS